ncbi:MAG TPA: aspartate kinase [Vicinamibacterales bacterium]|nr:aspartate kinase [Vicinamibacterales bacterium]
MKFGGTSVADVPAVTRLVGIVRAARDRDVPAGVDAETAAPGPVVVVSALGGVTDRLLEIAGAARAGDVEKATAELYALLDRHAEMAGALTEGARREALLDAIRGEISALIGLVRALSVLKDVSPRSMDAMAAAGELMSSRLVAAALEQAGLPAAWVDARRAIVTDGDHTRALPLIDETNTRLTERVRPLLVDGKIPVLGGFVGATTDGITTTLGRGGSDYSAALVGAGLGAAEIEIWTDVDGMLTADPRVVRNPRLVPRLTFEEASELAYFGAKVLHPSTILPAVTHDIPVRIKNSRRPDSSGTLIARPAEDEPPSGLVAIACKRHVTVINITSSRMLMAYGYLRRLFEVFERLRTAVDVVTTSEVSVSVTIDDQSRLEAIVDELSAFAEVTCERDMAIVCLVGENLGSDARAFGRMLEALDGIPLRMVSQAALRRNVTFVLRQADVASAMNRLHEQFFEQAPAAAIRS